MSFNLSPAEVYVDGAVAARQNPEQALDIHKDVFELVAVSPELYLAYTGVLGTEGNTRRRAAEEVHGIEDEINRRFFALSSLSARDMIESSGQLVREGEMRQRALAFTQQFESAIPFAQIPEISYEASYFRVLRDAEGRVAVNGRELTQPGPRDILNRLINMWEQDPDVFVDTDLARGGLEASDDSPEHIQKLRVWLGAQKLQNMFQAVGQGRRRAYRVRVNELQQVDTLPGSDDEALSAQEVDADRAMRFAGSLLAWMQHQPDDAAGRRLLTVRQELDSWLGVTAPESYQVLRSLRAANDLHIVGSSRGAAYVSTVS